MAKRRTSPKRTEFQAPEDIGSVRASVASSEDAIISTNKGDDRYWKEQTTINSSLRTWMMTS
jgi:hypothetical protein